MRKDHKKTKPLFILFSCILICFSCSKQQHENTCLCPHTTIYLQPYEDFTEEEANKLVPKLLDEFSYWLYGGWEFKVLKPIPLPDKSFVSERNRYRAIDILETQSDNLKGKGVVVGLTHKDICADVHNVKNYGIVGYSYTPGNSCVVSDKRLKNKKIIWKPLLHEFMHAFYGAKHCPKDDPKCFMVDAKGKGNFAIQDRLCDSCRR